MNGVNTCVFFFFQAEDGIRDVAVTGVQTCALPISSSQDGLDLHNQLLTQAQALRDQRQGVSLEEEAVNLLQYQRAFEAAARVIHVIDDLTQTAISLVPQA